MKVILTETIESLGATGAVLDVKPGYAKNYLIPRGLAVPALESQGRQMQHQMRLVDDKKKAEVKASRSLADALEALEIKIPVKVGEEDKLFGSVTNMDIASALEEQGYKIDRRKITIEEPIKALGLYTVHVHLGEGIDAGLKVWVVKEV